MPSRPVAPPSARSVVAGYEQSLSDRARRDGGVHYTPPEVADPVLELAMAAFGGVPRTVCDPACGGGAFLLSAADHLLASGVPVAEVVRDRLVGLELDGRAVAVARRALCRWAAQHGARVGADEVRVYRGDALVIPATKWPDRPAEGFDLVVGNPPFLSQLSRRTARSERRRALVAERFGTLGAYTDDAGLFLLAAVELVRPAGVVAMVQPQSLLSARDAGAVRQGLLEQAELIALWAHEGTPFPDADVRVCAPVLRRRRPTDVAPGAAPATRVRVVCRIGVEDHRGTGPAPVADQRWGALLGPAYGVPETPPPTGPTLGSVATATAGFRDEFYGLRDAMTLDASTGPRLVTVGMIDPLQLRWRTAAHRIGGRSVVAPRVDLAALGEQSPRVARWARDRLVPKVLVATQTRAVEAVADPDGSCVPMTPTISVEPIADRIDVWHLVAALSAPPVAAAAVRGHLGTGRSSGALRWSARAVLDTPVPVDATWWDRGALLARRLHDDPSAPSASTSPTSGADDDRRALLGDLGAAMARAYGLDADDPVVSWWSLRLPRR